MEWAWKLVMLATAGLNFALQALYFTHMLQLNSYRTARYRKWCRDNDEMLVNMRHLLPFLCIPAMWLNGHFRIEVLYAVSAVILLITALLNLPKKAKKPLVFTARVKRLLVGETVFFLLVATVCALISPLRAIGIVGLLSIIVWFWIGLVNAALQPLENAIARRYVRDAARILVAHPTLKVIGITGSYGKTSVKTFLNALLSVKYHTLMTPGSYNTTMGVVRTIREQMRPTHEVFLVEMGAKQAGDIREICDLVHPQCGVLSAIGEQHLETFGSLDKIISTKFELIDALPADGCAFLNVDNAHIRTHIREIPPAVPVITYGVGAESGAMYIADDVCVDVTGSSFTFTTPDGESRRFETLLLGEHTIENLAGCMAVAHQMGITLAEMAYPIKMLQPVEHRLQLLPNGYIDDAYNANPAGFRSALDTLRRFDARRVLVTPGMVELGERQESLNKELGAYAADACDIAVLVGKKQAPPLKEGLLSAGFPAENIYVAADLKDALAYVHKLPPAERQIVLLENDLPDNF